MTNASRSSRVTLLLLSIAPTLLAMFLWSPSAWADTGTRETRIALVIANFDYPAPKDRLSGPESDATTIADALAAEGFIDIEGTAPPKPRHNLGLQQTKNLINAFKRRLAQAGDSAIGFIYYAGHGAADAARTDNFILPTDIVDLSSADISTQGLGARWITTQLNGIDNHPKLVIVIDACRTANAETSTQNDASAPGRSTQTMRAPDLQQPDGMLMALSTGENKTASDNGMYARILAEKIKTPGLNLADIFEHVKFDMARETENQQIPVHQSQITKPVCLAGCTVAVQPQSDPMVALKMAMELRPTGDTGQVAAMEQMTGNGKSFAGLDLHGLYLSGAKLSGANFERTNLEITDLEHTVLTRANLSEALFSFSRMNNAKATEAIAKKTRFYFAQAEAADFSGLQGQQSNWQAASLRGSSFRNASLQGASFQMADLRDADFTGADLSGTFFMGALIAGATFDGATIDNTDFGGAIGSADQFTAVQQAGLCGTDTFRDQGYRITLRTFDKSAAIGDRYRTFYEDWAPFRSGWRYLEPCAPRTLDAAGKPPIWEARGQQRLVDELTLTFDSPVTDAADREDRIKDSAQRIITTLKKETTEKNVVTVSGERSKALQVALENNPDSGKLLSEPILDTEATFLFQVRFQPETISDQEWDLRAREWAAREDQDATYSGTMRWARFFPSGTRGTELSDANIAQFKRWTIKRAEAFPTRFALKLDSQLFRRAMGNMQDEQYDTTHTPIVEVLPVRDYAKENTVSATPETGKPQADLHGAFSVRGVALRPQNPPESYRLELPRQKALLIRKELPQVMATFEVTGMQATSDSTRQLKVLEGNLSDVKIELSDGTVISASK